MVRRVELWVVSKLTRSTYREYRVYILPQVLSGSPIRSYRGLCSSHHLTLVGLIVLYLGTDTHSYFIDASLRDMLDRVLPLATYYTGIAAFVESRSHTDYGLVNHALCAAIRDMLKVGT